MSNQTLPLLTTPEIQFVTGILLTVAIVGMIVYTICMAAVVRDKMYHMPYYALLLGLGMADIIGLSCFVFFALPLAIAGVDLGRSPENIGVGVILQFGWFTAMPFICLLAINRAICVHSTSMAKRNTSKSTWLQVGGCYVFGVLVALPSATSCCHILWWASDFTWIYDPTVGGSIVATIELCCLGVVGVTVIICFCLTLCCIYSWKKKLGNNLAGQAAEDHHKKIQEIKLFLQVFLTTMNLVLFELFFLITPMYVSDPWIGFTSSALYVSNCSINGYIYLTMNTKMYNSVRDMLVRFGSNQTAVVPMTHAGRVATVLEAPKAAPFGGIHRIMPMAPFSRDGNLVGMHQPENVRHC